MAMGADRMAELFESGVFLSALEIAGMNVHAGRFDEAVRWLRVAVGQRDPNVPYIGVAHDFRPLHGEEVFRELVESSGFEIHVPEAGRR